MPDEIGARVDWTADQKAELARQYARIGFLKGQRWEAPPPHLTPEQLLAILQSIPDGAGLTGWQAALRAIPPTDGCGTA
jgi:hypothetical protein